MSPLPSIAFSLIAETHLSDVTFQYREDTVDSGVSPILYVIVPVAMLAIGLLAFTILNRGPAIVNTPLGMLHELCRTHRIKGRSRVVMEQIADAAGLEHPAVMFLCKNRFDATVNLAERARPLDPRQRTAVGAVRRKLFG